VTSPALIYSYYNFYGPISWITATANSVVAMDTYGDFYTWGWSDAGTLGNSLGYSSYIQGPTMVSLPNPLPWDSFD